jgi:hypothetical protein
VFLLAFLLRAAYAVAVDPPLLYTHQYNYYTKALRIAEHPQALAYVLTTDEWRVWVGGSTIAPLYYLVLGAFFSVAGPDLLPLRLFQSALDALAAVAVASLGRRLAGPAGAWAGVLYAMHWSALEMTAWTMTENAHTVLLAGALALLAREAEAEDGRAAGFFGGLLLGLSGLARSVSSAFVPVAALWRLTASGLSRDALRRSAVPALLLAAGGLAAILPWTLRNRLVRGDKVAIETVGYYNLWDDNAKGLVSKERHERQLRTIESQATPQDYGRAALRFTWRNVTANPLGFLRKIGFNARHFLRPEGLHNLLFKEYPDEPWRHAVTILGDDLLLLGALPFFLAFVFAGRDTPSRRLALAWAAYYLFMVVVVFHTEARYRSALVGVFLAGAVAGAVELRELAGRRRSVARGAMALGLVIALGVSARYVGPATTTARARLAMREAEQAIARGDLAAARATAERAGAMQVEAGRPFLYHGHWLAAAGRPAEAADAYARALTAPRATPWVAAAALPTLLHYAGRVEEAEAALRRAHVLSWDVDPWLLLEAAWRELPAPRADRVELGRFDYGAVRGFHHPRGLDPRLVAHRREFRTEPGPGEREAPPGPHRWTRGVAFVRLRPTMAAPIYEARITMGSPFPSKRPHPPVAVSVGSGPPAYVTLDPALGEYRFVGPAGPDGVLTLRIEAPTWGRAGEPADMGVRVDTVVVRPGA